MLKNTQTTSDPLQRGSNISLFPPGYDGTSVKMKKTKADFDATSKAFESSKNKQSAGNQGGTNSSPINLKPTAEAIGLLSKPFTQMNDTVNETSLNIRDSISDWGIKSGDPTIMAISAVTKIVDAIGDATGFHIDDIDKTASDRAGVNGGARFLNNAMNAIPGSSVIMAAFSPNKTHKSLNLNDDGLSVMSGYSGSQQDIDAANKLGGKRTLFGIGRNKMNSFIDKTNQDVELINSIGYTNSLAKKSDYNRDLVQQNLNRYAGTNYQTYAIGRNGMKIMSRKEAQAILNAKKLQKGGVIGTDTNVLPEGALHARLNHLQDVNPDLEDATKKGIPVLNEKGDQIAEIERDELILTKALTDKLEALMKDGSDEAMIEAGKLLALEIIENTQDNTGQITEEVENGK